MGKGWRQVSELVRQKVGITTDKTFKATTNGRNEAMFEEATKFSAHLRTMERDLRAMSKQVDSQFSSLRNILISPLPRAFDLGQEGPVPVPPEEPQAIGMHVQVEKITGAAKELKNRLENEVIQPVKEWMVAYRTIQDRMKQLEIVRLELDSRRRTVANLQGQLERMKASAGSLGQNAYAELDKVEASMCHKQEKMLRTQAQFHEMERTVYNSLFTLVRDTSVLREYTAAALQIIQECFTVAHSAYDGLPAIEFSSSAPQGFGAIASAAIGASAEFDALHMMPNAVQYNDAQAAMMAKAEKTQNARGVMRDLSMKMNANRESDDGDLDARETGPYDQAPYGYEPKQMYPAAPKQQSMRDVRDTNPRPDEYQPPRSAVSAPQYQKQSMPGPRYNSNVQPMEQQQQQAMWSRRDGY